MRCALRSSSSTCADSADNGTGRLYTLRCPSNMQVWAARYHAASLGSVKGRTFVGVQLFGALVQPSLGVFTGRSRSRPTGELRP